MRMTKIDIISGFLGAGKTTLLKKLIGQAFQGEKLVLIENEFGEIGIDGGFLKDSGIEITEMNSGCICCSLVGDFGTALQEVLDKYSPDRVIIEPSGVGKLSDVIKAVENIKRENIELNSFVTVVDAIKCKMFMKNFGEFFNNQIENAKTIVLSRSDKLSDEKLDACVKSLKEHNENATIITTPWDQLSGKTILEVMEKKDDLAGKLLHELKEHDCCVHDHEHEYDHCDHDHHHEHEHDCCGHDHHHEGHHHADDIFTSWGKETPKKFNKMELEEIIKKLAETSEYGTILRAKGILSLEDDTWINFDLVPGEYEIRNGEPDFTGRLCVIGTELKEEQLGQLFDI
jgi:G3E family GTPase